EHASFNGPSKRSDLVSAGVVLAHMVLGYNIFKGSTPEESRDRIMTLPLPDFRKLDSRVDDRLNDVLNRALARDVDKRYPDAAELLYELEHYIYHTGYGPTPETLGKFIRELFGQAHIHTVDESRGSTILLDRTTSVAPRRQL